MRKRIELNSKNWQLPRFEAFEFFSKKNKYCICIPVLSEGEKFKKQLEGMKKYTRLVDIIIADWGSTDGSTDLKFLKSQSVRTLLVKKSFGFQATQLRMAFSYAMKQGYQGVIQIDGNGKDGLPAIPNFIKALEGGYDYVQGSRFIKGGKAVHTPPLRLLGVKLVAAPIISIAARFHYTDITNGFRAYSRRYLLHPEVKPFRDIFVRYALNFYLAVRANQLNLKTKEIPVTRRYPKGKAPTKITFLKGNYIMLSEIIKSALGFYHPKK